MHSVMSTLRAHRPAVWLLVAVALAATTALLAACGDNAGQAPADVQQPTLQALPVAPSPQPQSPQASSPLVEGYALLKGCALTLEVADTAEERTNGLMGRSALPLSHGMLFAHDTMRRWNFWMLNTLIPLDAIWLDAEGVVVDIQTMQPEPGVSRERLTQYTPRADALNTLEVTAGLAQTLGLAAGDRVTLQHGGASAPPALLCLS
ncbi:MAG: DUF192 domain-containing protein [Dehalococcoidia bacterium]|nr:DUF192 domain-containing protein [Dehalococcoidia bacterium]